ncbi:FIG00899176: hypothetical protein [Bacteroides xylanisolvens SD CC 1b]|uniref:Conjugative transposon protein TraI n=1 Tax=Bacteroides xylanisolvens SD CC 1b TaxID=702447 RepID=D4VNL4_9BACE|nr:conserved domain protein [Bacteroides xylanisolvens SD CC 1b]CDM07265.1 FIG00899176: hypothetical protein [Bacteroides xylanisolvens SD CC 1b]
MKWTIWISILLLCLTGIGEVQAQNDPVLAGMIAVYTEKAEKELKNQEKVMLMQTTGHIWTKEEVQATTDLQREFNNYLNSFRSIVCYAAQTYGFYYEVSRLTDNMGDFTKQLKRSPANTLAVALSTQRNKIYRELMMNSVEIVNDIRTSVPFGEQDDGKRAYGNCLWHPSKAQNYEHKAATTDQSGKVHDNGRHLAGNRRGCTSRS